MKPNEFWNSEYREMTLFCEINCTRVMEDFKSDVVIQEAVSNKLIRADGLNKRPKVISLKKMFEDLF